MDETPSSRFRAKLSPQLCFSRHRIHFVDLCGFQIAHPGAAYTDPPSGDQPVTLVVRVKSRDQMNAAARSGQIPQFPSGPSTTVLVPSGERRSRPHLPG